MEAASSNTYISKRMLD